jgi:hypothetical protein
MGGGCAVNVRCLIVWLLAGCAAPPEYIWDKPGATAQTLEADQNECAKQAAITPRGGFTSRGSRAAARATCMQEKGWHLRLKE